MNRVDDTYTQRLLLVKDNLKELTQLRKQYDATLAMLDDLPTKYQHEVMVPLCGSEKVLVPGRIERTNAAILQLGENHFVARVMPQWSSHIANKQIMAEKLVRDLEEEEKALLAKKSSITPDLLEEVERKSIPNSNRSSDMSTSIRKTPEGYVEIIEHIPDEAPLNDNDDGRGCKSSQPINGNVIKAEVEEPKKKTDSSKSIFATEFGL